MEKRKISITTFILVVIVVLAIGIGVGYLINNNNNNELIEKEISNKDVKVQTQKPKYSTEKSINANGNNHKIGLISEQKGENVKFSIYMDDKLIKTYEDERFLGYLEEFENGKKLVDYDFNDNIKVQTIKENNGNEQYIILTTYKLNGSYNKCPYLTIINENSEVIGTLEANTAIDNVGVDIKTGEKFYSDENYDYIINNDNIVLYRPLYKIVTKDGEFDINDTTYEKMPFSAAKYIVTIKDNCIYTNVERLYTSPEEVTFSGK